MNFRLDYPPSTNKYWRHNRGHTHISNEGRAYRKAVCDQLSDTPGLHGRLAVMLELSMPDNRKRDIDNVQKVVLDALAHAGIYHDDCQVDMLITVRREVDPPGCVDCTVMAIDEITQITLKHPALIQRES